MIEDGQLDQLVTLQQPTTVQGAAGGHTQTWTPVATGIWARIRHFSGTERGATRQGGGEVAVARTEIVIRYRQGITERTRVLHTRAGVTRIYDIKHVNNVREENTWLLLTCDTGVSDG